MAQLALNRLTQRTWRRGATSVEYLLILAAVVLPLGVLVPMIVRMISSYAFRIAWSIRLPFG